MAFTKVLVAVDASTLAAHAARLGIDCAKQLGAEVAFIAVVDTGRMTYDPNSDISGSDQLALVKGDARALLKAFAARTSVRLPPLEFLEVGHPATKIVEAARVWQADLIVMGTHGRSALGNLFLGSVAQEVLQHATCPVMVAREPGV